MRTIVALATEVSSAAKQAESHLMLYLALGQEEDRTRFYEMHMALSSRASTLDDIVENKEARLVLQDILEVKGRLLKLGIALIDQHSKALHVKGHFDLLAHSSLIEAFNETSAQIRRDGLKLARIETAFLNRQAAITAATELGSYAKRTEGHLFLYLVSGKSVDIEKVNRYYGELESQVAVLDERVTSAQGRLYLADIKVEIENLKGFGVRLAEIHRGITAQGKRFDFRAHAQLVRDFSTAASRILEQAGLLTEHNINLEGRSKAVAMEQARHIRLNIFVVMMAVVLAALLLGYLISRSITKPLSQLQQAASAIGKGRLDTRIDLRGVSEVASLGTALNNMAEDLHKSLVSKNYVENILCSMMDALIVLSPQMVIEKVNGTTLDLLGYDEDKLLGRMISDILEPQDVEPLSEALLGTGTVSNLELSLVRSDGQRVPVSLSSSAMRRGDDQVEGLVCAARDLSGLKSAEADREKLKAQLIQAQKMETVGTLAGGIAHDFNNILTPIMLYTRFAMDGLSPESERFSDLQEVTNAAERAKELVMQILTFSRHTEQERKLVRMKDIIRDVLKLSRASLPSNIEIRQNIATCKETVHADANQIHQVLMNLCTNAYHALQDKGGVITIGLESMEGDKELLQRNPNLKSTSCVCITVRDNGSGMDSETQRRIFEPFFTTKEYGKGTGLGLSVVHGIIINHGGDIEVESSKGVGTVFKVYLPRVSGDVPQPRKEKHQMIRGQEHILFVDDEEIIVRMGREILSRLGYKVTAMTSSTEALQAFQAAPHAVDLVVSDQMMPELTGLQLATEIKKVRADLPIIFITGYSALITPEKVKEMGFDGCLMKPFVAEDLAAIIRNVLAATDPQDAAQIPV